MTDGRITSEERAGLYRMALQNKREAVQALASHDREKYTSIFFQIRFGALALNAASIAAVLTIDPQKLEIAQSLLVLSVSFFTLGIMFSGYGLFSQESNLLMKTTNSEIAARKLDMAAALSFFPSDSREWELMRDLEDQAHVLEQGRVMPSLFAVSSSNISGGCWLSGVSVILLDRISTSFNPDTYPDYLLPFSIFGISLALAIHEYMSLEDDEIGS